MSEFKLMAYNLGYTFIPNQRHQWHAPIISCTSDTTVTILAMVFGLVTSVPRASVLFHAVSENAGQLVHLAMPDLN